MMDYLEMQRDFSRNNFGSTGVFCLSKVLAEVVGIVT